MYSARCSRTRTRRLMYGLLSSGFKNQERSEVVLRRALPGSRFHHGSLNLLSLRSPEASPANSAMLSTKSDLFHRGGGPWMKQKDYRRRNKRTVGGSELTTRQTASTAADPAGYPVGNSWTAAFGFGLVGIIPGAQSYTPSQSFFSAGWLIRVKLGV